MTTNRTKLTLKRNLALLTAGLVCWSAGIPLANALNLAQSPLYLTASQPPLILMTMARDHKLYYEAYNDYSDLDGDGTLDLFYTPSIEYYGYYDSYKCYDYSGGIFTPVSVNTNKKCTGADDAYWSGDFLNYVTTSRMDAIRKVFYGGKRSTDTSTQTVIERSFIPQDAHSWGKEYESIARDGYDIREYTPLSLPATGYRHLFANVTLTSDTSPPLLRVLNDSIYRIWEWVSIERPVAGTKCLNGGSGPNCATAGGSTWSIVPSSSSHGLSGLTQTTYNTGNDSSPTTTAGFDAFENTYGTTARQCGSGSASTIDGTGNPFEPGTPTTGTCASDNNYMTIFTATLNIATTGSYTFGIDGDDAIDLIIDGTQRVGWYGGHGQTGSPPTSTVALTLAAGTHTLKFRHHEMTGGDTYHLYWQPTTPASAITDYNVRVEVCKTITGAIAPDYGRESNCQGYGSSPVIYKPTGLLHKYGQNNGMYFGLLTGSYDQNTDGGVLRKEVSSITDEIEAATGIFMESGSTCGLAGGTACIKGIVGTINRLKITSFDYNSQAYTCGWITTRAMNNGECEMWGNPLGEMMYEGLRYFAGKTSPTSDYTTSSTRDNALGLPKVTWSASTNPFGTGKYPTCAKPHLMLISDVYPSFDSDKIQGLDSNFGSFAGDVSGLSVSTQGQTIWNSEFTSASKNIFIGQVGSTYDGAPTVKTASSFGNIRGLSPSEPTRQGSYYAASMAYYGRITDVNGAAGTQNISTYSIALAPPLPTIEVVAGTNKISLVPFAKSVGGSSINAATGSFQPTNQIVDFYIDTINNTTANNANVAINGGRPYYKFRINYEDVEQGADHDMDAIATYEVKLNADGTVTVSISSDYAAGGIIQHMGYVISGTTLDGVYLEVRDKDTATGDDPDYFLDTPNTAGTALPLTSSRTFTASSSVTAGTILKDPLWYAAKYGGFTDKELIPNFLPNSGEWDSETAGTPDNYFLVINPLTMLKQMDKALDKIKNASGTSAALSTNSYSFQAGTLLFQTLFDAKDWSGQLNAFNVTSAGVSSNAWEAQERLASQTSASRVILTYDVDQASSRGIPFTWAGMGSTGSTTLRAALNKTSNGTVDTLGSDRVTYLRGDTVTGMRTRPTTGKGSINKLGDIISSQAQYVGPPSLGYSDATYAAFGVAPAQANRTKMVYVGANDGMLHGFDVATGDEVLGYVPSEMYRTRNNQQPLSKLTQTDYGKTGNPHRFYVDGTPTMGDICTGSCAAAGDWKTILVGGLNGGGQGIYALDITNPSGFAEGNASTIVKWEFLDHDHDGTTSSTTITGDAELGYTYSRPFVVKLCTVRDSSSTSSPKICTAYGWYVIFGNGYNNTELDGYPGTGDAVMYVLDADTGYLVKKIALNEANATSPNGLPELAPIDLDGDGTIDYVYAGDLKGNLWRIDFLDGSPGNWAPSLGSSSNPDPIYIAKDEQSTPVRQPITTAPDVITHPNGGVIVIFGTGSYLEPADPATTQVQTVYGIWDKLSGSSVASTNRTNLQAQAIITSTVTANSTVNVTGGSSVTYTHDYRTTSANTVNWTTKDGWYMNLPESGERIAYNPSVLGGNLLKFSSVIPSPDICDAGGTSWDYYINAVTGARLNWSPFTDLANPQTFGSGGPTAYASARKSSIGITPPGTVLTQGQGLGTVFQGGSKGEMDYYKVNLGQATAGRISWREILND